MESVWNQSALKHSVAGLDNCTSSRNILYLCAVIPDLPARPKQLRLITRAEGSFDTLLAGDWTCNMIAIHNALSEPKKVFSNLQLRDFLLRKHHHGIHYRALVGLDTEPIKLSWILSVMQWGVLYQHAASTSLQEVHTKEKEGLWASCAITSCSVFILLSLNNTLILYIMVWMEKKLKKCVPIIYSFKIVDMPLQGIFYPRRYVPNITGAYI